MKTNKIELVQNKIQKILDNCCLTPLEILGVLEIAKQEVHEKVNFKCNTQKQNKEV